jgi:RpiB/LacA/LacB family sugar-phosphate isomerase
MSAPLVLSLGSDHAGFALKRDLLAYLSSQGIVTHDRGAHGEESCDYPVHAQAVAADITSGRAALGVLICSTGVGISIAANKVPGIRAALVHEPETAALARRHNDANILCFGARHTPPALAIACLEAFLAASFEGGRHARRLGLIEPR